MGAPAFGHYLTDVLPVFLLMGAGAGLSMPAAVSIAMSGATADDSGITSGLVNTTQQIGGALGLGVMATAAASRTNALGGAEVTGAAALTGGYHFAFVVGAVVALTGVVVALVWLRDRTARPVPR